ncbi:hypothetical protein J5N97_016424 [Dioscorea zingiberensis]|uniref:RING-type domain-containing protein n=1 Tax=Dioscorea zingiberensis TaxID=325984 RepID=A0A9D5CK97_9LILI|nr:hypothetical protein J5N97_016424 [Dioscorea zingiberensis]
MSSPSTYCYSIVLPKPLLVLVRVVDSLWLPISGALFKLGLASSPGALLAPSWDHVYVSDSNMSNPKINHFIDLPVIEFSRLRKRSRVTGDCEEDEAVCGVCLSRLEQKDEVRELGNCSHVFHMECIDKWVNIGHLTCPMCRSQLLPSKAKKRSSFLRFPWKKY